MNKLRTVVVSAVALAAMLATAAPASAVPVIIGSDVYELISAGSITWNAANAAASGMTFNGVQGHLATLTSSAEDTDVTNLVLSGHSGEWWIGGFQQACAPEPGCGWTWVNGEGAIPGTNSLVPYANWALGEPNNSGSEMFAAIYAGGVANGAWNDEAVLGNIQGYLVEYNNAVPEPATLILVGSGMLAVARRARRKKA